MDNFFFIQLNPTHPLTDPTQPIVPAHGPTQPTHLTAMQGKASILILVWHNTWYTVLDNFQLKIIVEFQFNVRGIKCKVLQVVLISRSRRTQPITVSLNPTHDSCQKIRRNPTQPNLWMDPTDVHPSCTLYFVEH